METTSELLHLDEWEFCRVKTHGLTYKFFFKSGFQYGSGAKFSGYVGIV
jgi:hypothetical protein